MTSRSQAARILDFGEGLGAIRPGRPLRDLRDRLELDAERVAQTWWVMALDTGHISVFRDPPGVHVRPHDVARIAELRTCADVPEAGSGGPGDQQEGGEPHEADAPPSSAPDHLWHRSHSSMAKTGTPPIFLWPS